MATTPLPSFTTGPGMDCPGKSSRKSTRRFSEETEPPGRMTVFTFSETTDPAIVAGVGRTRQEQVDMATLNAKYQPYPAYKSSGIEWLGDIPAHWEVRRLKTLATVQLSNVDKKSEEGQAVVGLCNYVDVYYNERIRSDVDFMVATASEDQIRRFSLHKGDVLVTKDSESWTDIAVSAVVSENFPDVLCGYHLAHIRPGGHCDGAFLSRAFSATGPGNQYETAANGITRFGLTGDAIREGVFPVPPLKEQRAIADFLDRETARIDALVAKKERLIELLQEKRTALITRAVTRGLDPDVPMKDSGVEWLGEIPAHWEVKRLKHLVGKVGSGKTPKGGAERYVDDGVMLLRSQNVHFGGLRLTDVAYIDGDTDDEMAGSRVLEGDVLLNITGASLGRSCVAKLSGKDANVNQHVCIIRPNQQQDEPKFLAYSIESRPLQDQIFNNENGVSRDALNFEQIGDLVFARPSKNEQQAIAASLERETAKLDSLVAKIREAIERLRELRSALISAAVTGRIDVREEAEA
ncbi:MAG: restriction endonuclease subunit S [Chloroflexi bacterium]|nr:restriction endonuclease subunit S [Chloroflexota bacterium]